MKGFKWWRPALTGAAALVLLPLSFAVPAASQQTKTQTSPLATEPLPTQGAGQVAPGAAVTGSSPGPGTSGTTTSGPPAASKIDDSQAQQGSLLKPGPKATDMDAASGARPRTEEAPK